MLGGIEMRKNNMRTIEEKENIVKEMILNNSSISEISKNIIFLRV